MLNFDRPADRVQHSADGDVSNQSVGSRKAGPIQPREEPEPQVPDFIRALTEMLGGKVEVMRIGDGMRMTAISIARPHRMTNGKDE